MDDTLKADLECFKEIEDAETEQREDMRKKLKFVKDGDQWPSGAKAQREAEGRPCLTINRLGAFGKQVINDARQNRPQIKVHPVGDGADKDTADILSGLVKNIEYISQADVAYDTAIDFSVTCGIGYATVDIDYADADTFDKDIKIKRVQNIFSVYGDKNSKEADSSDWNDAFITDSMPAEEFKKRWPKASPTNFATDDPERQQGWYNKDENTVRIAERWLRERIAIKLLKLTDGSIMEEEEYLKTKQLLDAQGIKVIGDRPSKKWSTKMRIITGAEILEENPWPGKFIPIIPCYGDEINIDGKRSFQGLFHFAIDPQQNFNLWRTVAAELVGSSPKTPFIGRVGAFDTDIEKWTTANQKVHAFIQYDGAEAPERQQFAGPPAGALQEALNASDDLKNVMGLHDASLGARSNETSGVAIKARQGEGDVSTFNFIDNQRRFIAHLGRIIIDLIPKVYDTARVLRVIKEDGSNYAVPVNQPVQQIQSQPQPGQAPQPQYQPVSPQQQAQMAQQAQQQGQDIESLIKVFDVTTGKYDVVCESGPSYSTRRQEASDQMAQLIHDLPNLPPKAIAMYIRSQDWPNADEFAKTLDDGSNPQVQQMQQQLQQLQQELQQAQSQLKSGQLEVQLKTLEVQGKQMSLQKEQILAQQEVQKNGQGDGQPTPDLAADKAAEYARMMQESEDKRYEIDQNNATKIVVAEISANTTLSTTEHAIVGKANETVHAELGPIAEHLQGVHQHLAAVHEKLEQATAPKNITKIRDPQTRKLIGVKVNDQIHPISEMEAN